MTKGGGSDDDGVPCLRHYSSMLGALSKGGKEGGHSMIGFPVSYARAVSWEPCQKVARGVRR